MRTYLGLFLLFCGLLAGDPLLAKDKTLTYRLIEKGTIAVANVPAGVDQLAWQRYDAKKKAWAESSAISVSAPMKNLRITPPSDVRGNRWRLVARKSTNPESTGSSKFPAAFLRGARAFSPHEDASEGSSGILASDASGVSLMTAAQPASNVAAVSSQKSADLAAPQESDIWKVEGDTIYYFNELRGLQVINAADPADPVVTSALRLPARGQDLYVLPQDAAAGRPVALITNTRTSGATGTEILLARVADGQAKVRPGVQMAGWPVDSRIIGNRLFVATESWESSANNWQQKVRLAEFDLSGGGLVAVKTTEIAGSSPVLSAGGDWLTVATQLPVNWNSWQTTWWKSELRVFRVNDSGAELLAPSPIRTAGQIQDQYKIQVNGDVCTAISMSWGPAWTQRRTVLQNFRLGAGAGADALGSLELANGESLYATRFDGTRAYVVTFRQTDPLWVVDLSDPANPVVAGHLEVPGWSTHLTPLGDGLLFSIGYDSGKISASLFDVSAPAAPALLSRVNLGTGWSWSEATWDEKALNVIPAAGLALVPVSSWTNGTASDVVQILDIDVAKRELRARGTIPHEFTPRRAAALGENIASISQRALVVVGAADRDNPAILSDVLLAWPVDRVLVSGEKLIEIENGSGWGDSAPTVRIATAADPDAIEAEFPLTSGLVSDAALRDGKLFIVRSTGGNNGIMPYMGVAYRSPGSPGATGAKVALDVYDCSKLPSLPLLGSTEVTLDATKVNGSPKATLTWPVPNRAAIVLESQSYSYWGGPIMLDQPMLSVANAGAKMASGIAVSDVMFRPWPWYSRQSSVGLLVVDVLDPLAPIAQPVSWFSKVSSVSAPVAADGLLAFGYDSAQTAATPTAVATPLKTIKTSVRPLVESRLQIAEIPATGPLVLRSPIDLPGPVVGITQLDRSGALVWTQTRSWTGGSSSRQVQVCAYDGTDAMLVASQNVPNGPLAFSERSLFAADSTGVARFDLSDAGQFVSGSHWDLAAQPGQLLARNGLVLATSGTDLSASKLDTFPASSSQWTTGLWISDLAAIAGDNPLFVPVGAYGVDVFSLSPGTLK